MLTARKAFSRIFASSAASDRGNGHHLVHEAGVERHPGLRAGGRDPADDFRGVADLPGLDCPGSTRSGEKHRKKSRPGSRPAPSQDGKHHLAGRARIGGGFQYHRAAPSRSEAATASEAARTCADVGIAGSGQRCRHADRDRVATRPGATCRLVASSSPLTACFCHLRVRRDPKYGCGSAFTPSARRAGFDVEADDARFHDRRPGRRAAVPRSRGLPPRRSHCPRKAGTPPHPAVSARPPPDRSRTQSLDCRGSVDYRAVRQGDPRTPRDLRHPIHRTRRIRLLPRPRSRSARIVEVVPLVERVQRLQAITHAPQRLRIPSTRPAVSRSECHDRSR